jgi:hypothetical protein
VTEPEDPNSLGQASERVVGERGIASVNQARSLQSRVSNILAIGLMSTLGLGLLAWYYIHTFAHRTDVKRAAQAASRSQATGEMPLPSLGRIDPPAPAVVAVLGPAPEMPAAAQSTSDMAAGGIPPAGGSAQPAAKPAWMLQCVAGERRGQGGRAHVGGARLRRQRARNPPEAERNPRHARARSTGPAPAVAERRVHRLHARDRD